MDFDRPCERSPEYNLLLTVTGVSTNCAVVIFTVKVSCISSVGGIILGSLICLVNYVAMLLVVCHFFHKNAVLNICRYLKGFYIYNKNK